MNDDKREALAALEHEQWAHWTAHMIQVLHPLLDLGSRFGALVGDGRLREADAVQRALEALDRWTRQMNTPYADLTEQEKESDREWADKVLAAHGRWPGGEA